MTDLATLAIAETASHALLEATVLDGNLDLIKAAVRESAYWSEFCRLVAEGRVTPSDVSSIPALAECVTAWARVDLGGCRHE